MNTKNRFFVCIAALFFVVPALSQEASSQSETPDSAGSLVLVAGATGRTGRVTVTELLKHGYKVRAFVRNADTALEKLGTDIEYAVGDVRQRETIDAALDGVSIIMSSIGGSFDDPSNGPEFVDFGGVKNLADAASDAGLTQFVLVSSMGVGREGSELNAAFGDILMWKFKGEEAVRNSGVTYTIVRPGGLTDEAGGQQELLFKQGEEGSGRVSRADVARVTVAALSLLEAQNKTFELLGGDGSPSMDLRSQFAAMEED